MAKRILFICLGNICRSPLAEGIFNDYVAQNGYIHLSGDSAGTSGWHIGEPPHPGSQRAAANVGVSLASQTCRQIEIRDFTQFDIILGMDQNNLKDIEAMAKTARQNGLDVKADCGLFLDYADMGDCDVPDPYGKSSAEYDRVAKTIVEATPIIANKLLIK